MGTAGTTRTGTTTRGGRRARGARRLARLVGAIGALVLLAFAVWIAGRLPSGARPSWLGGAPPPAPARPSPGWPVLVGTLAGTGAPAAGPIRDGAARSSGFSDPFGVAIGPAGSVYVSDAGEHNLVARIEDDGTLTVLAGGREGFADGRGASAAFDTPSGLAIEALNSVVVADTGNNAIRRVTPDGTVTTLAGGLGAGRKDGPGGAALFDGPVGVAVAPDGSVVVADTYNDCIRRIGVDGVVSTVAGGRAAGYRDAAAAEALFDTPAGVAVAGDGTIFVADTGNNVVRRIDTGGLVSTLGPDPRAFAPAPPSLVEGRRVRLSDIALPPPPVPLLRPTGIAVRGGDVYVTDALGRVIAFSPDGVSRVIAGSWPGYADGVGARARFNRPAGVAVDARGIVRLADADNFVVRVLTPPGTPRAPLDIDLARFPLLSPATPGLNPLLWPVDPQDGWHEVAATLGEARGTTGGDGRGRLHAGLDVRAPRGTVVRAVRDEKVSRVLPAVGFDTLNEMVATGLIE